MKNFLEWNLDDDNLCFQKTPPDYLYMSPKKCIDIDSDKINYPHDIFKISKEDCIVEYLFIIPKLNKCKIGQETGLFYIDCWPREEYNTYIF